MAFLFGDSLVEISWQDWTGFGHNYSEKSPKFSQIETPGQLRQSSEPASD
jgi:hypothetical protein